MRASRHHRKGFTLAELLFSMAIGSIVLLLAASMLGTSGESYERVGANVAAESEARASITQLGADLSTAYFHINNLIEADSSVWAKDKLGFLCLKPEAAQTKENYIGDLCAVHYYVADRQIAGKTTRCLMRGFRESNPTFASLREQKVPELFLPDNRDEPIAFGVVSFRVIPKTIGANGTLVDWVENNLKGPTAFSVRLIVARRDLSSKLRTASDWDQSPELLGSPGKADENPGLEIYETTLRFGQNGNL